jgi:hypothetical protein
MTRPIRFDVIAKNYDQVIKYACAAPKLIVGLSPGL